MEMFKNLGNDLTTQASITCARASACLAAFAMCAVCFPKETARDMAFCDHAGDKYPSTLAIGFS
jgi:hypothetical protein